MKKKCTDIVGRWEKKAYINDNLAYRLKTRGSIVAKAYALPKIHKPILEWKLIVSTIGSPNYNLAFYIAKILKSVQANNSFYIKKELAIQKKAKKCKDYKHALYGFLGCRINVW